MFDARTDEQTAVVCQLELYFFSLSGSCGMQWIVHTWLGTMQCSVVQCSGERSDEGSIQQQDDAGQPQSHVAV